MIDSLIIMNHKRLSREDSRERTTQRLLDAGRKLIAQRGLSDTTLEDIVEAAGYTRGAFYSNFSSKGDLFIELLRRDHATTGAQLRALRDDSLPFEHIHQRIREIHSQLYRTNESFMNWTEARVLAARDAKFRAELDTLLLKKRAEVAELMEYVYRRMGRAPPLSPQAVAMGLNSLFEGVKLNMLSSPAGLTAEDAQSVLTLFVDFLMQVRPAGSKKISRRNGEPNSD
jgi:AcrR family transcriptional regulator